MAHRIICNLTVIRSSDLERAALFYKALGLPLSRHSHGSGPMHYAFEENGHTFEIYPLGDDALPTTSTRLGFSVASVDETLARLLEAGGSETMSPRESKWGRRAVVTDPDGHRVELTSTLEAKSSLRESRVLHA